MSASFAPAQNHALRPPASGAPPRNPSQNSSHRSRAFAAPGPKLSPSNSEPPYVIDGPSGRIACVADVRGNLSLFNHIAAETGAHAIIHTGDFGFYDNASLERISDRTLRHLVQYSTLVDPALRTKLLGADPPRAPAATEKGSSAAAMRQQIAQHHQGLLLSHFSDLLTGKIKLQVPVFTVWGACEDVAILERFRTGEYQVNNLFVLDEATTKAIEVGGIRLRLFGLGGAVVLHKLFDNGEGAATIAGGQGTMWTTALQIGELIDTAQKTFDPTETRLLITHASPGREGLLAQLALALKADLTVSAGLHFRYGASYNEFSVQHDAENYRNKLQHAKHAFGEIWDTVKAQVDAVIDENQRMLLNNALAVANRTAPTATATGAASEEPAWKNTWNWNLPDAAYGNLVLSIRDGRVSAETKSQGFNFAYRRSGQPMSAVTPTATPGAATGAPPAYSPNANAPTPVAKSAPIVAASASAAAVVPAKSNAASSASTTPATATTPAKAKASDTTNERAPRSERGHESAASRSDFEGGFTSGTDGRKSPSGPRRARNPYTLYVSQLKEALPVTEEELRSYFGPAAAGIFGIKLVFDKPHRRGASSSGKEDLAEPLQRRQRPFAYVEFRDEVAMQEGLKRQGEVLKGDIKPALEQADSNKASQLQTAAETTGVDKGSINYHNTKVMGTRKSGGGEVTDKEEDGGVTWTGVAATVGGGGKSDGEKPARSARGGRKERAIRGEKGEKKNVEVAVEGITGNNSGLDSPNATVTLGVVMVVGEKKKEDEMTGTATGGEEGLKNENPSTVIGGGTL
uniref:Ser thr protein phosphatase n=1 Tax=Melanopsichium pennsylvanicum 4 TaxID=1398559 RepID=A0A077R2K9_9BASI|nr:ser thr protein phosphatase [Melanopsichium pennsylvanicum 4]